MQLVARIAAAATLMALAGIAAASAQSYPSRSITMVVGFPAGGSADVIARIMAENMRRLLDQPVIVENTAGASGSIGTGRVARATPDGYTIGFGSWSTHVINGAIYSLKYDLLNDFAPISLIATQPLLVVGRKDLPASSLSELIAWLKASPGKGLQGTAGPAAASHIAGLLFQRASNTQFQLVPYRGAAPAMQDLLAGQIDMMIDLASNALPHVQAGSIRSYAVTAKSRLASAPNVPTVDEAGLPGYHVGNWFALWAPKDTPPDVMAKLNAAVVDVLSTASVRTRMTELGQDIFPREQLTTEALAAWHKAEIERWWPIIKAAGITAQ